MQYEDWEFHHSRLPQGHEAQQKALQELEERFLEELRNDPRVTAFLEPYNPDSTESFLKNHATWKRIMVAGAKYRMNTIEKGPELRYREETEDVLDAILYKKLFNAELLWRAGQLHLPGVEVTWDFWRWHRNPRACPFLETVTQEEISVMQRFLRTDDEPFHRWGNIITDYDYNDFTERDEEGLFPDMPDWFEFYDTYMGTGHLLLLPNVRKEKERYYSHLWREERQAQVAAEAGLNPAPKPEYVPPKPSLYGFDKGQMYQFSKAVDDEIFQQLFRQEWEEAVAQRQAEDAAGVYDIEYIVNKLESIPDPPPVRGGLPWRKALLLCWNDYLKSIIIEDLPLAWEEYRFYKEAGIPMTDEDAHDYTGLINSQKEHILRGRELAGEPRDFNF